NALVISVSCSETTTLSVATTLTLPPSGAEKSSAGASRAHKRKKTTVKLPVTKATVQPGVAKPVAIKIPKSIANKYAGRTLTAKVAAPVRDSAGNVGRAVKPSPVKIAPAKKKGKPHHGH